MFHLLIYVYGAETSKISNCRTSLNFNTSINIYVHKYLNSKLNNGKYCINTLMTLRCYFISFI